nr:uncharacterized protein LOC113810116 isoform X1 [Penaeus vannamei]
MRTVRGMSLRCAHILAFFIVNLDSPLTQAAVFRISKGEWKSYEPLSIKANLGNATILDKKPKQDSKQISPDNKPLVIAISTIVGVILLCIVVFLVWYLWKWRKVKEAEKQTLDRTSTVTYHRYSSSIEHLPGSSDVKKPDQEAVSAYGPSGYKYNPPQRFEKYTPKERRASNRRRSPPRPSRQRRNSDPHMTWSRARDLGLPESGWQVSKDPHAKREIRGRRPYRRSIMSDIGPAYSGPHRRHDAQDTSVSRRASNRRSPPRPSRQRRFSDPDMTWTSARELDHQPMWEARGRRPNRRSIMSDLGPAYSGPHKRHASQDAPLWYERLSRPPDYYSREAMARSRRPEPSWHSEYDFPQRSRRRSSPPYGRYNEN